MTEANKTIGNEPATEAPPSGDPIGNASRADLPERLEAREPGLRWPQALRDMTDVATAALRELGLAEPQAAAFAVMRALSRYQGGRMFYLPKGDELDRALRDRQIWEDYDYRNVPELAARYGLTEKRIYEIIKVQRALHRQRIDRSE